MEDSFSLDEASAYPTRASESAYIQVESQVSSVEVETFHVQCCLCVKAYSLVSTIASSSFAQIWESPLRLPLYTLSTAIPLPKTRALFPTQDGQESTHT